MTELLCLCLEKLINYTVSVICESRKSLKRKPQKWYRFCRVYVTYCLTEVIDMFWIDLRTTSSCELWSSINLVVLQSRGDDVTDVTVNLRVIPVVTFVEQTYHRWIVRTFFKTSIRNSVRNIIIYGRCVGNEEALTLHKHAAVRH